MKRDECMKTVLEYFSLGLNLVVRYKLNDSRK